tara:strand:- start:388 stop:1152 length:765 start_codon:yes stop_codon:yes gene_type:complete
VKTRKIKKIEYPLFKDEKEFKYYMPNKYLTKNWRDGEEGDWVLTDDGQVCMVIKRGSLSHGTSKTIKQDYVRTVIGSFLCKPSVKMGGRMRKNMYSFGSRDITPKERQKERKKPTNSEFLFAKYVAKGDDIVDAFIKAFPTNNRKYAKREAGVLLRTNRVKSLVREEIDKLMNEAEITPLYILEKMKDIIESEGSRDSDKVSLLKELVSIAGMKDTEKKSESVTVFQGFSPEQLNAIGGNNVKKLAKAEREIKK